MSKAADSSLNPRHKWNNRYTKTSSDAQTAPLPFVRRWLSRLPTTGYALDVAAGAGRHALALARRGLNVDAIDISEQGLRLIQQRAAGEPDTAARLQLLQLDIERGWLPRRDYDVIVVSFFLHRPLFGSLQARLKPGGWLLYETFMQAQQRRNHWCRRSTPEFFLKAGELRAAFADLNIQFYSEGIHHRGATAQLLAQKPHGG